MTRTGIAQPVSAERGAAVNGPPMAAMLAAGIGSFAMGLFVLLNEVGLFAAPALHTGAGGVSGRTTLATATWLIGWALLHSRWRGRRIEPRPVHLITLTLVALGIVATFPPVWNFF